MKFTIPMLKPRNPLVAASRFRKAGAHRPKASAQRQALQRELRVELERGRHP